MDLPCRYPYNPQWRAIGGLLAIGLMFLMFGATVLRHRRDAGAILFMGLIVLFGGLLTLLALLMLGRRLFLRRFLALEAEVLVIPCGFLRARPRTIPYTDIETSRETTRSGTCTFSLRAKGQTSDVLSNFFVDIESYRAVRDFLRSHVESNKKSRPKRERQPGEGIPYGFQCNWDGNGAIYKLEDNPDGDLLWHVRRLHPSRFFPVPDFGVFETDGRERFRIKIERRLPKARFVMVENGRTICTIRQRTFLFTKYTLDFVNGPKWSVHIPLFTVCFRAESDTGAKVRIRLVQHPQWLVLIDDGADSPELVAALAFLHRERQRHG
jgi:hypothetical protein